MSATWWQISLGVIGGYCALSFIFLLKPQWVHRRKNVFRVIHSAHRGGLAERPENTIVAFANAVRTGTHLLELDVHLSADEKVIVSHDRHLERITGQNVDILGTRHSELPRVRKDLQLPPPFYPVHPPLWLDWKVDFKDDTDLDMAEDSTKLPTLDQVFARFPDTPVNIDLKHESDVLVRKVVDLVHRYNRHDTVAWGSGRETTCEKLYEADPRVPLIFSFKSIMRLYAKFYSGLLPFWPIKESFFEVPLLSDHLEKSVMQYVGSYTWKTKLLVRVVRSITQSPILFKHLRRRGIRVVFWVLNTEEEWKQAFELGADGVMTDRPSALAEFLCNHPEYPKPV